jgi:hypothetical protein
MKAASAVITIGLALSACSDSSPVDSSPVPPAAAAWASHSGTWMGTYTATCANLPTTCGSPVEPPPAIQPILLTIYPSSNTLAGPGAFNGSLVLTEYFAATVQVSGTILDDGTMTLTGAAPLMVTTCRLPGQFAITDWRVKVDASRSQMTGTFAYTETHVLSSCYSADLDIRATQLTLKHMTS